MPIPALYGRPGAAMPGMYGTTNVPTPEDVAQLSYGEVGKGAVRTLRSVPNQVQAMSGQLLEPVAPEFGRNMISDAVRSTLQDGRTYAAAVPRFDDVHSLNDALLYAGGQVGQMAPYVPLGMGAAGVGRVLGGAAGAEAAAADSFFPVNAGDYAIQMAQDPEAQKMSAAERAGLMVGVGGAQSALEGMIPAGAVERLATRHAAPRTLGAAARSLVGETAKGIGASGLEEGTQELVGQLGQQYYAPDRPIDWNEIKENAIGGAVGVAPHAAVHAGAAHALDAADAGARGAIDLGKKGIEVATPYVKKGMEAAAPYVDKAKAAAAPHVEKAMKDAKDLMDDLAASLDQTKEPGKEPTFHDVMHETSSAEDRVRKHLDAMTGMPEGDDIIGELTKRRDTLLAAADVAKNPASKAKFEAMATMLNSVISDDEPNKRDAWADFQAGARSIRNVAQHDDYAKALSEALDDRGVKYSNMGKRADLASLQSDYTQTKKGAIETELDRAFRRAYMDGPGYLADRAAISERVHRYARLMMADPAKADTIHDAMLADLKNKLDPSAGAGLFHGIHNVIGDVEQAQQAGKKEGRSARNKMSAVTSVGKFVRDNFKGSANTDSVAFASEAVSKFDELMNKIDTAPKIDDKLIGKSLNRVLDIQMERSPDADRRELARAILSQQFRELMTKSFKNHSQVADKVRQLNESVYGRRKDMQSMMGDIQQDSALQDEHDGSEAETDVNYDDDGEMDRSSKERNRTRLSIVDSKLGLPGAAEFEVLDTLPAATGHPSAEHGEFGEIGKLRLEQEQLASAMPAGQSNRGASEGARGAMVHTTRPGKASSRDAMGYAEIGRINMLEHLANSGALDAPDNHAKIAEEASASQERASAHAQRVSDKLQEMGYNADDLFNEVQTAFNKHVGDKEDALAGKEPWRAFDARTFLHDLTGSQEVAQLGSDYYWNTVRARYDTGKRGAQSYFERFPHYYVTRRNNAGGHEMLNTTEINKAMVRDIDNVKGEDRTLANGYYSVETADGPRDFDLPRLLEHSLGKVRTRDETDEETYDRGMTLPDGKPNVRYASDLLSAYSAMVLSMLGAKHLNLSKNDEAMLLNPPDDTTLVRPTMDRAKGEEIGRVTMGDLRNIGKPKEMTIDERYDMVVPADGKVSDMLKKGILFGTTANPLMDGGEKVGIDVPKLLAKTAQRYGMDMAKMDGDQKVALLNVAINDMRQLFGYEEDSEGRKSFDLRGPVIQGSDGNLIINPAYVGLNLDGKTGGYVIRQAMDKGELAKKLFSLNAFAFDKADAKMNRLSRSIDAVTKAIEERLGEKFDQRKVENQLGSAKGEARELEAAMKAADEAGEAMRDPSLTNASRETIRYRLAEAHTKIAELRGRLEQPTDVGARGKRPQPATKAEIERMRRIDAAEFEAGEQDKTKSFYNKDDLALSELQGKLENMLRAREDKAGRNDDAWVANDDVSGLHEERVAPTVEHSVKNTGKGDGSHEIKTERKTAGSLWQPLSDEVVAKRNLAEQLGDVKEGRADIVGRDDEAGQAVLAKAKSTPKTKEELQRGVTEFPEAEKRYADYRLNAFVKAVQEQRMPNFAAIQPNMYHAFYKAAGQLGENGKGVQARLVELAKRQGVDATTGESIGSGATLSIVRDSTMSAPKDGPATMELGKNNRYQVKQDGKVVGVVLATNVERNVGLTDATIETTIKGGKLQFEAQRKALEAYDGDRLVTPDRVVRTGKKSVESYSRLTMPDGSTIEGDDAAKVIDLTTKMFGRKIDAKVVKELFDNEGREVFGKHGDSPTSPLGFFMRLSERSKGLLGSNALHESLHGLFTVLRQSKEGLAAIEKVSKTLASPIMHQRIEEALKQLGLSKEDIAPIMRDVAADPDEAVAYAFQLRAMGMLNLMPEQHNFVRRVSRFFKDLLQITTAPERTEAFFDAFLRGDLGAADFKPTALERAFAAKKGDEIMRKVSAAMEPFKKVMQTVFDSATQAMERFSEPEARELLDKYAGPNGFIKSSARLARRYSSQVEMLMREHGEGLQQAIKDVYAGKTDTPAARAVQAFMRQVHTASGVQADYLPQILDHEKIKSNRKAFEQALRDYTVGGQKMEARDVLDLISDLGFTKSSAQLKFLPQASGELANWVQTDPAKFFRAFIVTNARNSERARIFQGKDGDAYLRDIKEKYGEGEFYHKAKTFVDGMEGRLGKTLDPRVRDMMKIALTVGNIVTLPFALFSAAVDPFHLGARGGTLGEVGRAYARGLKSIGRTIGEAFGREHKNDAMEQLAEDIGAIEHAMLTDVLGDTYLGDTADGWTKKVNDWFFKANFLDGWTRQMRVAAVAAGQRFIVSHANGESPHSARFLEELGLTKADVKVTKEGALVINDKIANALNQFVDESIVRPDQTTNALWMNDPRFMLLAHMKRFTYAFNDVVLGRAMSEMNHGNLNPLMMLGASIPAILLADMGKHLLKGDLDTWMNNKTTMQWFNFGMNRAGLNGKMQFSMDAMADVQGGGTPFDSAMGPDIGMLKKMFGHAHPAMASDSSGLLGLADDFALAAYNASQSKGPRTAQKV